MSDVPTHKTCTKCDKSKPLSDYYKNKRGKYGVRGDCRSCVLENQQAYNRANVERRREHRRAWREANAERKAAYDKAYYEANKERAAERNRAYLAANPHKRTEYRHRRRARLRGNDTAPYKRADVFARDGYVCQLCGRPTLVYVVTWRHPLSPELDHIVPVSRGGSDTPDNVQTAHRRCNIRKGNRV